MIMATAVVGVSTGTGKRLLRLGAYSDLSCSAERLSCSADPPNTSSSSSIVAATARKSRRAHSVKALKDPQPCLSPDPTPEYLVDAVLLLQKSMLEKQWNLSPKHDRRRSNVEVTGSGTSARRRRIESRKKTTVEKSRIIEQDDEDEDQFLHRGYVKGAVSDQLLTHAQVVQLSQKIKVGLALEDRRSR